MGLNDSDVEVGPELTIESDGKQHDHNGPNGEDPFTAPLHRKLKSRHLQMIAIAGKIDLCSVGYRSPRLTDIPCNQALSALVFWLVREMR